MKLRALRILLAVDSAVLFLLGVSFLVVPQYVEFVFGYIDLPLAVTYIVALWGCILLAAAIGYWKASADPIHHIVWVQVGIARGVLECGLGIIYLLRGIVTFRQAGAATIAGALFAIAYLIRYPRSSSSASP